MIKLSIRHNFPEVMASLRQLPDKVGNKALVRAMNTTIKQGKTEMSRKISQEYRVKVGEVKDRLDVTYAKAKDGDYRFEASLLAKRPGGLFGKDFRGMNLIHFVTAQAKRNKKGKLGQLSFQIKRTGGRKILKGAFIAKSRTTGGVAVFMRQGKARMPIETKTTIDVPQMFNARRINEVVVATILKRFDANFKRELRSVLQGYVK